MKLQNRGFWINETVPDLADVFVGYDIDALKFSNWFGGVLGNYRMLQDAKNLMPTREEELDFVKDLNKNISGTLSAISAATISPVVDKCLRKIALQTETDLHALLDQIQKDLGLVSLAVAQAENLLSNGRAKKGRKRELIRDSLLFYVITWLRENGVNSILAPKLAEAILLRCRIPVPGHEGAIKNAARRDKKSTGTSK